MFEFGLFNKRLSLPLLLLAINIGCPATCKAAEAPFAIRVVDQQSGRGVPLVELRTTPDQIYLSDSNGYVAIDDPVLESQDVFFHVKSHGYELARDLFGFRGRRLKVEAGREATIEITRLNVAERLYRITGAGIYRDTVRLGKPAPIDHPLLNAQVCGQDTVMAVVNDDKIYWFWGDTDRLSYPLGHFNTSGATSLLPKAGGLTPDRGINLRYFVDESGFSRPMFPRENGTLIWVHGVFTLADKNGRDRIVAHYSRRKSLSEQLSHGIAVFDEEANLFQPTTEFSADALLYPRGQAFRARDQDHLRSEYVYFTSPYATVRVPARWDAVHDATQYEAFTPLSASSQDVELQNLERDSDGKLNFGWKQNTAIVTPRQLADWVANGELEANDNWFRTTDVESGDPIQLHRGSIRWNEHRQRWIMIANQIDGGPSYLGEVWYVESRRPEGPFLKARRIVTHDAYSFYNVTHHDFLDQEGGHLIYFEGTYTKTFSKTKQATPWYDYNQVMYRLDLSDSRLQPTFAK